jgi:flagellar biosynthesis anti-sigma factor FlgM
VTIINGGNDPRRTSDINGSARTSRPVRPQGSREAAGSSSSAPSLEVSAQGGRFSSLRARLETMDANRAERVERLRLMVASGAYHPNSEAIAAAMLADPATASALGIKG